MRCGRPAWRCRQTGPTPSRVARSACGWSHPAGSRRLVGLAVALPRGPPVDASPVRVVPGSAAVRFSACASASHERPCPPVVPNQSAISGYDERLPTPSARRLRSPPPPRMRSKGCHPEHRAPLLRFSGPFSVRWPRRVLVSARRPARRKNPASTLRRDTRAFRNEPCRETRPCGFALSFQRMRSGGARCGGRAGVGVPAGSDSARGALFR